MRVPEQLSTWVLKNPVAWLLLAILAITEYSNYARSEEIAHLCQLTAPHEAETTHPVTARDEIDNICIENDGASQPNE
jgi:hypothetical protein